MRPRRDLHVIEFERLKSCERRYGVLHRLLAEGFLPHIPSERGAAAPLRLNETFRFCCIAVLFQVNDGYICTLFGKQDGHSAPDATVAARDQGNLVPQLAAAPVRLVLGCGSGLHGGLDPGLLILVLWRQWRL